MPKRLKNLWKLRIEKIVIEQDQACLYGPDPDYKVIATVKQGQALRVGNLVDYEPCGQNFGWYHAPQAQTKAKKGKA